MTRKGTLADPHGFQQLAEYLADALFDIVIPMRKIVDSDETYAVEMNFQVQSMDLLSALEDHFVKYGASILAQGITKTATDDGSIVSSMELCSPVDEKFDIINRVRIRISHVKPGKRD